MASVTALNQLLDSPVHNFPEKSAIEEPGKNTITYREFGILSDAVRDYLRNIGVGPGDRVGIYLHKSIDGVTAIFGIMKAGAAYVPVDPGAPAVRNAYILKDCSVKAVFIEKAFEKAFRNEFNQPDNEPHLILLEQTGGGEHLRAALEQSQRKSDVLPVQKETSLDDLAYILYTSGSTGKPKGVMLSHQNALTFVDWCSEVFQPSEKDRFSSHAPLHFDLSILDLYVSIKHGATLVLIGEDEGKEPLGLAQLIARERITMWYSAPSILSLLAQYGDLKSHDYSALRMILFAGEVFPVKHLRALKSLIPSPRYFNLYGPTETNVCTFYEIPSEIPPEQSKPFPIGKTCSHLEGKLFDEHGLEVASGKEGELCIRGPAVMQGYWNLPERTARAFIQDDSGQSWYKTGDIVIEDSNANYIYLGRRDRMVKRRGYRVELGEIESCLYRHPSIKEVGVVALTDEDTGVRIKAFISTQNEKRPSRIELKGFCAENLPLYMVPDVFAFHDSLPKTSTGKIDYQKLIESGDSPR